MKENLGSTLHDVLCVHLDFSFISRRYKNINMQIITCTLRENLRVHKAVSYLSHFYLYSIDFIHEFHIRLLILNKRKLNRHKNRTFPTINRNTEKQANGMLINTYPSFPPP